MKRKWLSDLGLYLPAFLISFVIWLIAKQGDTETRMVAAPVRIVGLPENVEARIVPTHKVEVSLIFPKMFLKNVLEPGVIQVNLTPEDIQSKAGVGGFRTLTYPVLPSMVHMGDLPQSVRLLGVVPDNVTVEARLHTVEAEIDPRVEGEAGEGFELHAVHASPPRIELTGAPQALAELRTPGGRYAAHTIPVNLEGATRVVSALADLVLPPGIRPVDPQTPSRVEITADIRETIVTHVFKDVPIVYTPLRTNLRVLIQPPTTNITARGPRSRVRTLTPESFRFVPNAVPNEAVGATNILSFRVELAVEEGQIYELSVESDVRTVTLLFEERVRPTPTPVPSGTGILRMFDDDGRALFPSRPTMPEPPPPPDDEPPSEGAPSPASGS